jgi:two-component system cell cycle sensor histidine kinase PleC
MEKFSRNTGEATFPPNEPNWVRRLAGLVSKIGVLPCTLVFTLFAIVLSTVIGELTFYLGGSAVSWEVRLLPVITPAVVAPPLLFSLFYVLSHLEKTRSALRATLQKLDIKRLEAEKANTAKSDFLTRMSHEFRTPLNSVIGFSSILEKEIGGLGKEDLNAHIRDIGNAGSHLLDLVNDLLDLSKIEAGLMEFQPDQTDVEQAINGSIQFISQSANEAGIRVLTELPPDLPSLHSDERKLKQMLINLLSNAIKFTPSDGIVVVRVTLPAPGGMQIEVCDTGVGIEEKDIPAALEAFGQIDSSLSRQHDGTGLGLPLVASLMELHGGMLEIDSEPGSGTMARLVFPADKIV